MSPSKPNQKQKKTLILSSKHETENILHTTFGEKDFWKPYRDWCAENELTDAYYLLSATFRVFDPSISEIPFKTILNGLTSDDALNILASWSKHDAICKQIYQLALKAKNTLNTDLIKLGPISSDGYSHLSLKPNYMLMLFFEGDILINNKCHLWVTRLRIWLLVHAIYRTKRNVFLDSNLKASSSFLISLISKKKTDWVDLLKLETNPEHTLSFSAFDSTLKVQIKLINLDNNTKRFNTFINALERISQNEDNIYNIETNDTPLDIYNAILSKTTNNQQSLIINASDWQWQNHIPIINNDNEENFNYALVEVDDNQSYTHQKLSAKSRLISQDEYLHFLPWSWNRITHYELKSLENWINTNLTSKDPQLKLLAVITWIALNTGRTLLRVLDFTVSDDRIDIDWTFSPNDNSLKRLSAEKEGSWKPKSDEQSDWIKARSELNVINLPNKLKNALTKGITQDQLSKSNLIADLWGSICSENIEVTFSNQMQGALYRIKSGMLATLLGQKTFNHSNNGNFSQLVSSHPKIPLIGCFAYGSWDCDEILASTNNNHECQQPLSNVTAIGSHLNPIDELLIESIKLTTTQILSINKTQDPIQFHNAYSAYLVMSLMAGTGIRAVNDVFESIKHFNLNHNFVFINDKASDQAHMGRLSPVPDQCSHILQNVYPLHLKKMAAALISSNPKLSNEIKILIEKPSNNLPLFFFIDADTLNWQQITPASIDELELFDWPLPANLFRQRLIKRLTKAGVHQNIINAWHGHKETNLDQYGDYSVRCWLDDIADNRIKLNDTYNLLNFKALDTFTTSPVINKTKHIKFTTQTFGIKARAKKRKKHKNDILKQAQSEIDILLNKRELSEIDQTELEEIELKLFLTPDKNPHPHALIRSELFNKLIDKAWDEKDRKHKINHRRVAIDDTFTFATALTGQYLDLYHELKNCFDSLYKNIMPSKVSKENAKLLVCLALIFENRICYPRMLIDIYEQKNFRVIRLKKQFYLEYSENTSDMNWKSPVQRHHISTVTAALADKLLSGHTKTNDSIAILDQSFISILKSHYIKLNTSSSDNILMLFCKITSEANKIALPGNISGYLSGRAPSSSLNWIDWVRLLDNKILSIPNEFDRNQSHNSIDNILKTETTKYNLSIANQTDDLSLMINAKAFFNDIKDALKLYRSSNRLKSNNEVKAIIKNHSHKISSSILLVGEWINYLIVKGKGEKKAFANSSPSKYFSALSSHMIQIAFDKDLFLMDSEDVTELYNNFLLSTKGLAGTYHADRLKSFIKFCGTKGIEDPDWSELDMPQATRNVRPGLICEIGFLKVLNIISTSIDKDNEILLHMAFLLIACYRFGLRSREAIYLRRKDLIDDENGNIIYLLIRNSPLNNLKTVHSRRIVPLLFELTEDELSVIDKIKANYQATHHDDISNYLFFSPGSKITPKIGIIRSSLISLLKQVTGNENFVNHHLRHSFFNIINLSLLNLQFPTFRNIINNSDTYQNIRRITLGESNTSVCLRNNMAAARLMGHTHPRNGFVSYNHFTDLWADTYSSVNNKKSNYTLKNIIDIDLFKRSSPVSIKLNQSIIKPYAKSSMFNIFQFLSLISSGLTSTRATSWLNQDPEMTNSIMRICYQIEHKTNMAPTSFDQWNQSLPLMYEWIKKIPKGAWKRLIKLSSSLENKKFPQSNTIIQFEKTIEIIGANRQLTVWENSHISTVHQFLRYFDIPFTLWDAFSLAPNNPILDNALFNDITKHTNSTRKDLDQGISADQAPTKCPSRINLIFQKNSIYDITDSYQLITCLIAFIVSTHAQP